MASLLSIGETFRVKLCDVILRNRNATTFEKDQVIYDAGTRTRRFSSSRKVCEGRKHYGRWPRTHLRCLQSRRYCRGALCFRTAASGPRRWRLSEPNYSGCSRRHSGDRPDEQTSLAGTRADVLRVSVRRIRSTEYVGFQRHRPSAGYEYF